MHIGMRSTRLRTQSNHELIVPNKSLLDEQVTNFTLSDNVVRRSVTMTVERTVPIRQAKRRMLNVVRSHPLVLKTPRPVVLVKEIDNYYGTTTFEVYFALHLKSFMECAAVQSKILERIGSLFPPATPKVRALIAHRHRLTMNHLRRSFPPRIRSERQTTRFS